MNEDLVYTLSLTGIEKINPVDMKKLMEGFSDSRSIFNSDRASLIRCLEPRKNVAIMAELILRFKDFDPAKREIEKARKLGISLISLRDENYPRGLRFIPDPPPVLYVGGKLLPEDNVALAVVGTRRVSNYGRTATTRIVRDLMHYNITIVSGLARGVDSIAHRETVAKKGRTIAVMATGADITYPPENKGIRKRIEENGAVLTEFPLGSQPEKWRFPFRNRIISGLSLGCLVVEAPKRSGALITARLSMEYNREVFAIPGNITSYRSEGCNTLIREGAKPVTCAEDILEEFDVEFSKRKSVAPDPGSLTKNEIAILSAVEEEGSIGEMIIQNCSLSAFTVNAELMQLELKGILKKLPGNLYVKIK